MLTTNSMNLPGVLNRRRAQRAPVAIAAAAVALMTLSACTGDADASPSPAPSTQAVNEEAVAATVEQLPHESIAPPPPMHLADGVMPPTNRWYSSLAFGDEPQSVFAMPVSFTLTEAGFTLGLPRVDATPVTIFGSARQDIGVDFDGIAGRPVVSHADPVAVTMTYADDAGEPVADVHLAGGWPVVGLTAMAPVEATLTVPFLDAGDGLYVADVDGVEYGLVVTDGSVKGQDLVVEAGGTAQWFAVPAGTTIQDFASALGDPVTSVATVPSVGDDTATTSLSYLNQSDPAKTVTAMPEARAASAGLACDLGTYETVNGTFAVCATGEVAWDVPRVAPSTSLDLEGISDEEREAITVALTADAQNTDDLPADSYFGTKALYRIANLADLAVQLGEDELAAGLLDTLEEQLLMWGDPARCEDQEERCFVYDPEMKGLVGLAPAFGSDEFNDHHFHYGYLLYASAVAVEHRPAVEEEIGPMIDVVAATLASAPGSELFPEWRNFDPFAGHSWASGISPFADGNNQESSSEAVTAWNGLGAWAAVREDDALGVTAQWMLSAESDAALRVWLRPDLSGFAGFEHEIVTLQWGGKRDYATWFSAEPGAMLGIELIPLSPATAPALAPADAEAADQIRASVAEAAPEGYEPQFGDYLLMYLALAGPEERDEAWELARALPDTTIDNANSRAYMLAWIAALDE
jgi:endoglucanase Acf2